MSVPSLQPKPNQSDLDSAIKEYISQPGQEKLARLVEAGSRLVYHFATIFAPGQDKDDMVQAGFEGLIKAAKRFDQGRGVSFSTYASHYIMGEMRHYIRKEASCDRPNWVAELQNRVNSVIEEHLQSAGEAPTVSQIAEKLNVREEGVIQAMRAGWVSIDEINVSDIQSQRYESFRLPIEDRIILAQAVEKLSEIQRKLIGLLFYSGMTQREAANELGLSQRKISRLLHKSYETMKKTLSRN